MSREGVRRNATVQPGSHTIRITRCAASAYLSTDRGVCSSHLRILAAGYPQEEHVLFWMWNDLLPHRLQRVCVLLWRLPAEQHQMSTIILSVLPQVRKHRLTGISSSPKDPVPFPFFPIVPR